MPPATIETLSPPAAVGELVEFLKRAWRQGTPPDTAGAMREHPELFRNRSLAVDLAYEEYCLLEAETGHPPDTEEFCRRLPAFASQVREVIRGHRAFADHPELFAQLDGDWPRPGDSFEGFVLERELGRGGFARVYLARDPDTGNRPIALKLSQDPSHEARTLGPITHPHIVTVHWAKRVQKLHAICMPFVGATTLADVIDAAFRRRVPAASRSARTILAEISPTPGAVAHTPSILTGGESYPDAVVTIAVRLAEALVHLHGLGVSHGDLKPSNVILGSGAHPYLIDFNLATGRGDVLLFCGGTVPYMAPERLRLLTGGNPAPETEAPDPAPTDVYSLGAVLFELLTGQLPFKPGDSSNFSNSKAAVRALLELQARETPDAAARDARVPVALSRVLAGCLSVDPLKRPSARALLHQLRRHLDRRARRRRLVLVVGGLLGAGVLAWQVAAGSIRVGRTEPTGAEPAVAGVGELPPNAQPQLPQPALRPNLPSSGTYFQRGIKFLRENETVAAQQDFAAAQRLEPSGRNTAYRAYCLAALSNNKAAATLYEEALNKYGYKVAWVHSNRAASLIQCGSKTQLREAIDEATAALALEPDLRAAFLNRAFARFLLELAPATQSLKNPGACLADLEAVLVNGPYTLDLYFEAAQMLAAGSAGREDRHARAVECLRKAVELGRDPKNLAEDPVFGAHLSHRQDFKDVTLLPHIKPPVLGPNLHVVAPPTAP
jgi:serine/threonine protein kinase